MLPPGVVEQMTVWRATDSSGVRRFPQPTNNSDRHSDQSSRGLRLKKRFDFLQQTRASLASMTRGELCAEFDHRDLGAGVPEGLRCDRRSDLVGANQQEIKMRDAHQEQSIAHAIAGLDV